ARSCATYPSSPNGREQVTTPALPPHAPCHAPERTGETPDSLNIKLKIGNMELMLTMRDVDDLKLQRRATMSLPWLQEILHGCEANLEARKQEAERSRQQAEEERQAQARSLDEQIAAALAAALQAQTTPRPTGNGAQKPPAPPALEPTNATDPS